ncbi:unnamed protein product [Durusdinium trenchii]|uniref:Transporter n=2 Tax=Durusdinium trenchii TaxID=1381693 RepID=A0ABP0PLA4_9DINO
MIVAIQICLRVPTSPTFLPLSISFHICRVFQRLKGKTLHGAGDPTTPCWMWQPFYCTSEWRLWSWCGILLIGVGTWYQVHLQVLMNSWFGDFYDLLQKALAKDRKVSRDEVSSFIMAFARIATVYVVVAVLLGFFTKHWTFRWRQAMNDHYTKNWQLLRRIEGASQRVQEDTRRFAVMLENIGASMLQSVLTLVAFLPILLELSTDIHELPLIGETSNAMVKATILWALLGTVGLAVVGIRLPGLEFDNQQVEAAFRKELVYGEDDEHRAESQVVRGLFEAVRRSYFRLYFNFMYFDVAKFSYLHFGYLVPYIILAPNISEGKITLGHLQRLVLAFGSVERSFQFLVRNWAQIVDLLSVYKRLRHFNQSLEENGDWSRHSGQYIYHYDETCLQRPAARKKAE